MNLTQQDRKWAEQTVEKIRAKMHTVAERCGDKVPYTTKDGVFDDRSGSEDISWWTNGFWGGMMWQMYCLTKDEMYRMKAESLEKKLDAVLMNAAGLDHDNGFKWLPTAVANYRVSQNENSYNRAVIAANNLAGRFIRAWNDWGLTDSHLGIILMHAFTATGVFLMRQFFMGIPTELLEAARIDGLSEYGIWAKLMLPLSKPVIATLCLTSFTFEWNDFMGPLIYLSTTEKKTLQVMLRMFNTQYSSNYALIMAAATVALIPVLILFVFLQRYFVEGVATSGLKG